jgi:hypothetical protein
MRHLIAVGVAAVLVSLPANAQQPSCFATETLDALLAQVNEAASVEMTDGAGDTIRIYANVDTGKWHLFVIPKAGHMACLAAAGENYTRYPSRMGRGA